MAASNLFQEFSDLECDVCSNMYNEDRCPRLLPCSHTFCGPCIDGLILAEKKECPVCRKTFTFDAVEDVAINRSLLNIAKQLSLKHERSKNASTRPKNPFLKTTQDFREIVTKRGIADCQGAEAEVQDLIDSYREMKTAVEEVKLSSEKTLSSIDKNIKLLLNRLEKMQKNKAKLEESDAQLEAASDYISAAPLMQEAEDLLQAMEETMTKFQEDKREEHHVKKEILKLKENLEKFVKDTERIPEEEEQQEEREQEEERDSVVKITAADLRSPHAHLRGDAQGEIFVVMTLGEKLRVAPVKIEPNNKVSFNHLLEGVLPPRCFVIELESLIQVPPLSPSPPPPPMAFLDLSYEATLLGRVIIRVPERGLKSLNFLCMCAGGMGLSYANSQVLDVWYKGGKGESISMGAYVSHGGGTSTQAVLSSRDDWIRERKGEEYYEETHWKAGDVRGNISFEEASGFWIVTSDNPNYRSGHCFGKVVEGLDVLKNAILMYPRYKKIKVVQCGLIL